MLFIMPAVVILDINCLLLFNILNCLFCFILLTFNRIEDVFYFIFDLLKEWWLQLFLYIYIICQPLVISCWYNLGTNFNSKEQKIKIFNWNYIIYIIGMISFSSYCFLNITTTVHNNSLYYVMLIVYTAFNMFHCYRSRLFTKNWR